MSEETSHEEIRRIVLKMKERCPHMEFLDHMDLTPEITDSIVLWEDFEGLEESDEVLADLFELYIDLHHRDRNLRGAPRKFSGSWFQRMEKQSVEFKIALVEDLMAKEISVSKLADLTHIPSPYLNRFLKGPFMPPKFVLTKLEKAGIALKIHEELLSFCT
jgi:hypothetical protein